MKENLKKAAENARVSVIQEHNSCRSYGGKLLLSDIFPHFQLENVDDFWLNSVELTIDSKRHEGPSGGFTEETPVLTFEFIKGTNSPKDASELHVVVFNLEVRFVGLSQINVVDVFGEDCLPPALEAELRREYEEDMRYEESKDASEN